MCTAWKQGHLCEVWSLRKASGQVLQLSQLFFVAVVWSIIHNSAKLRSYPGISAQATVVNLRWRGSDFGINNLSFQKML